jgi:hypothetical protein
MQANAIALCGWVGRTNRPNPDVRESGNDGSEVSLDLSLLHSNSEARVKQNP